MPVVYLLFKEIVRSTHTKNAKHIFVFGQYTLSSVCVEIGGYCSWSFHIRLTLPSSNAHLNIIFITSNNLITPLNIIILKSLNKYQFSIWYIIMLGCLNKTDFSFQRFSFYLNKIVLNFVVYYNIILITIQI